MSYQVRKGWPSDHCVDETIKAGEGQTITDGMIVAVIDGLAYKATFTAAAADTDPMIGFVIGMEKLAGTITALMSQDVIEVNADHYEAGSYAAGDYLTSKNGKFAAAGTFRKIGRVMKFDASTGIMRVLWYEAQ